MVQCSKGQMERLLWHDLSFDCLPAHDRRRPGAAVLHGRRGRGQGRGQRMRRRRRAGAQFTNRARRPERLRRDCQRQPQSNRWRRLGTRRAHGSAVHRVRRKTSSSARCSTPTSPNCATAARSLTLPGCGSATEISTAEEYGVEICKVFPGESVGGPGFIKAVLGPMPWSRLMPTGGCGCDTGQHRRVDQGRRGLCGDGQQPDSGRMVDR